MSGSVPVTNKQKALIHMAVATLGIDREDYRAMLVERYPSCWTGSCTELTYDEASDLIDRLKAMGFEIKRRRNLCPKNVTKLASRDQLAMIARLEEEVAWRLPDGALRFRVKIIGRERPATSRDADKLIEALKSMASRLHKVAL